jgi:hypothetical protein
MCRRHGNGCLQRSIGQVDGDHGTGGLPRHRRVRHCRVGGRAGVGNGYALRQTRQANDLHPRGLTFSGVVDHCDVSGGTEHEGKSKVRGNCHEPSLRHGAEQTDTRRRKHIPRSIDDIDDWGSARQ